MQALTDAARRAGLVVGLLVVFLILMSFQVNRARTLASARSAVFNVVSPVQRLGGALVRGVTSVWDRYFSLVGAAGEVAALRQDVASLRRQIAALQEVRRENERLRTLAGMEPSRLDSARVARVVARDLAHRFQSVTIDRGGSDGVVLDAPVIAPNGSLVGRVVQVAPWTAMVQLITDPLSGVGARLSSSRGTGVVSGTNGHELELRFVDSMTNIARGERVITSGEDEIYPPGIPIGAVTSVTSGSPIPGTPRIELTRDEAALFMEITVAPDLDLLQIETVLVLDRPSDS